MFYEPNPPTDEQQDGGYQQHHYPSPPHPPHPQHYPGPRQRRNGGFRSFLSVGGFPDIFADGSNHFTTKAPFRSGFKWNAIFVYSNVIWSFILIN